jgi:hypothetical protein
MVVHAIGNRHYVSSGVGIQVERLFTSIIHRRERVILIRANVAAAKAYAILTRMHIYQHGREREFAVVLKG